MNRRLLLAMAVVPLLTVSKAKGDEEVTVRWDIVHFTTFSPPTFQAGGSASAKAEDNSKITLTGSGTFKPGESDEVTGGGTWKTYLPNGTATGKGGRYTVTGLIKFDQAPGTIVGTPVVDHIGNAAEAHSGLVFLRIRYDDGSRGVLAVSCALRGVPPTAFEGITASKGYVDYWNHDEPVANVDGNRTVFHITSEDEH